jgi:hypothetical protein
MEDAAFQPPFRQLGEEALDGVELGAGCRREVEGETFVVGHFLMFACEAASNAGSRTTLPGWIEDLRASPALSPSSSASVLNKPRPPPAVR